MKIKSSRSRRHFAAFGSAIMLCLSMLSPLSGGAVQTALAKTESGAPLAQESAWVTTDTDVAWSLDGNDTYNSMRELSARAAIGEMGAGISLEDAMTITGAEDCISLTEYLDILTDLGFRTIRIPLDCNTYFFDETTSFDGTQETTGSCYDLTKGTAYLSHVRFLVDAAAHRDMYVILTVNEYPKDSKGVTLFSEASEKEEIRKRFGDIWREIARVFSRHDEHVIFEAVNETGSAALTEEEILNEQAEVCALDQIFVDTIREIAGGNNSRRILAVNGLASNPDWTVNETYGFKLPEDKAKDRLMVSVKFSPREFAVDPESGKNTFGEADAEELENTFAELKTFTDNGTPVLLCEYGSVDRENAEDRAYYTELVNVSCRENGVAPVYGNHEGETEGSHGSAIISRADGTVLAPLCVDAIMRGMDENCDASAKDISKEPDTRELKKIVIMADTTRANLYHTGSASLTSDSAGTKLLMKQGEDFPLTVIATPQGSGDPVVYSTSDASVITVSGGVVKAKGVGRAVLYACSRSGSVCSELAVEVSESEHKTGLKALVFSEDSAELKLVPGESADLQIERRPEECDHEVNFSSTDESVAFVTPQGRVYAQAPGTAVVVVTASNGIQQFVPVTVCELKEEEQPSLALKVTLWKWVKKNEPLTSEGDTENAGTPEADEGTGAENRTEEENLSETEGIDEAGSAVENESVDENGNPVETDEEGTIEDVHGTIRLIDVILDPVSVSGMGEYRFPMDITDLEAKSGLSLAGQDEWKIWEISLVDLNEAKLSEFEFVYEYENVSPEYSGYLGSYASKMASTSYWDYSEHKMGVFGAGSPDTDGWEGLLTIPNHVELLIDISKIRYDLSGYAAKEEVSNFKASSPTNFSLVIGETTDIYVCVEESNPEHAGEVPVIFLSCDRTIAKVDSTPQTASANGRIGVTVEALEAGTTTIKAVTRDLKVVSFTVKVTREKEVLETGKEEETTTKAPETGPIVTPPPTEPPVTNNALEVIMLGVLLGVIVLFMVIGTAILLKSAQKKG